MPQPAKTAAAVRSPLSEKRSGRKSFSGTSFISFEAGALSPSGLPSGRKIVISALSMIVNGEG